MGKEHMILLGCYQYYVQNYAYMYMHIVYIYSIYRMGIPTAETTMWARPEASVFRERVSCAVE